ncbi:MAG: GDP-mannose 4,6-dehydratase [Candidatus Koribacter versatilis]|uniref:GDP-mannose 4,6-dehydratase n=1 Tax=Candidatus Korobacter versatilis TaxID=658062 RepID=A0A932EPH0_9BACT|nr:GDP-mannose 4,6-dehydratase [Candidatus Koribacter versatilis]
MSWKGRRVLVTGADGFIGSHLAEALACAGAHVRAFCLYNSQGKLGWLEHSPAGVRAQLDVRLGDVRDARFVEDSCRDVEVVFHLAALIAIPYSYIAPQSFVQTNVDGTLNVLEACRRARVARLVHTSTSEVYGTPDSLPIRETHPLKAQSPYAATKVAADQLALSYHLSFGVPVTVVRPFNTYGPRQSTRAVTATILSQLLDGGDTVQLGRLDTRRDLTFVADVVAGFLAAGEIAGIEGKVIQLGTGRSVTIGELFEAACRVTGKKARAVQEERRMRPEASEVMALESDPSLARQLLGWQPATPLEEGLRRTAEWMHEVRDSYRADFFYA